VNFPIWKALVLSTLRGVELQEFLDDKVLFPPKELIANDKKRSMPERQPRNSKY
jgi:hypothetical protein